VVGITAGSREVPGRNACDRRHTYCTIIIIIIIIGALAVPVFGIINWRTEETQTIDRKTIKMLTMYKMHHPKADIDRLYVKRKEGGRRLVQIEAVYKAEIINIAEYLNTYYKEDQFLNIVKSHESTQTNMNSIIRTAAKITEELI